MTVADETSSTPSRSKRKRLSRRKKMLFIAIPFLALFLAGEVTGRLLERYTSYTPRRRASYAQPNPFLRNALTPGIKFRSGEYEINVNSYGFRGDEFAMPKPPGTFRIFAIGESTTFGWKGVKSHLEAWPALLQENLRQMYPARSIEVINAGVPGYTSIEQRINFMLRISKLQPDAIVIYHGNNDINWSWVPDVVTKTVYGREPAGSSTTWWDRVTDHSYVFVELRSRLEFSRRSGAAKHDDADPAALAMLHDNLRGLIQDAKRANVRVAIATFAHALDEQGAPSVFSDQEKKLGVPQTGRWFDHLSPQGARKTFPLYNAGVRALAAEESIPLCEVGPAIPKTTEYHTDWCHFTVAGEKLVAQQWSDTIRSAGWLK